MIDKLVRLSAFTILLGRGYQHLFWDVPYRAWFWDELWWGPLFRKMGWSWSSYVTNPYTDLGVELFTRVMGVILIIAAISSTKYFQCHASVYLLRLSGLILAFMNFCQFKEYHYELPMLFEHTLQIGVPWLLSWHLWKPSWEGKTLTYLKIMIALTFMGHGAYALGLGVPVPAGFVEMIMESLRFGESEALHMLTMAGFWDFAIGILIFIPLMRSKALAFAAFWGLATAMARTVSYVTWYNFMLDGHSWFFESTFRLCHGLIPLAVLLALEEFKVSQWSLKTLKQTSN